MPKHFNTAGPNQPDIHYTLDPESRLPDLRALIDERKYFVLHAPRQTGKTTLLDTFAKKLTDEGKYTALMFSIEASRPLSKDVVAANRNIIDSLRMTAKFVLPTALRPPEKLFSALQDLSNALISVLGEWAQQSSRPLIVFIDEIDSLADDALLSVLHQLRNGYKFRPKSFPQTIALVGVRDVREYKVKIRPERQSMSRLQLGSPFNIKARSIVLPNFSRQEVRELYLQHTAETGQKWADESIARAFELTQGQPWLTNALAAEVIEEVVTDASETIMPVHLDAAKEALILRRDTHLDSLVERLYEDRVRRIIDPILAGSASAGTDVYDDDLLYVADLGLVTRPPAQIRIANPIYAEVIPRALSFVLQSFLTIDPQWFIKADGRLDMGKLLTEFQKFYRKNSEMWIERYEYKEAAPHLILYAWLQRVVNSGGHLSRESALGTQQADILIEWPVTTDPEQRRWPILPDVTVQREVLDLKLYEDKNTESEGLQQLSKYLDRVGEQTGHLLLFDRRPDRSWDEKIFHRKNVTLPTPYAQFHATVWGL